MENKIEINGETYVKEENSNYCCYYCNSCDSCNYCNYCNSCDSCNYCNYCNSCDSCNYCNSCDYCNYCDSCDSCNYCNSCDYCNYCNSCENLVNGFMCINLKLEKKDDSKYWIFNKEVTKEVWDKRFEIKSIEDLKRRKRND